MKLDANKLAVAAALAFAVVWAICSAVVVALPGWSMRVSGDMMHTDLGTMMSWSLNWPGFIIGLVVWSLFAAATAWLIATFYNWQVK